MQVAVALCKDYPVRYVVAKGSQLKNILSGEGNDELPGELLMEQDAQESGEEEGASV